MNPLRVTVITLAMWTMALAATPADAKKRASTEESRTFIERTRIAAPKRVGEFLLDETEYDPRQKAAGAALRYTLPDHPELRIDLFVYPAGEMPQQTALKQGMATFRESLGAAVKAGFYSDLQAGEPTTFEIPPADGTTDGTTSGQADEAPADPELAAMITAALGPKPIAGERIDLQYRMPVETRGEPVPMRSRGYLFYRQLYYVKSRISAAQSQIDQPTFDALSDRAMRELVPAVMISNVGSCAKNTISVDPNQSGENAMMLQLLGGLAAADEKRCFDSVEEAAKDEPGDAAIVVIDYEPSDWGGK